MGKKFRNRKGVKTHPEKYSEPVEPDRNTEKPWESIYSGWRGRQKYSREWNSGYNGSGRGTW